MAALVRTRSHTISLGLVIWLAVGFLITLNQDYWNVSDWDNHFLGSLFAAVTATVLWPIALFYKVAFIHR